MMLEKPVYLKKDVWESWTLSCAVGALLGMGSHALFAVVLGRALGEPRTLVAKFGVILVMSLAGAFGGAVIGLFQWRILGRWKPQISRASWTSVTAGISALGWFLGMIFPTFFPALLLGSKGLLSQMTLWKSLFYGGFFGLLVGCVLGAGQWWVLRKTMRRAERWIVGNALGWFVAVLWMVGASALPPSNSPTVLIVALGGFVCIVAGISVGAITGAFLVELEEKEVPGGSVSPEPVPLTVPSIAEPVSSDVDKMVN